MYRNRSTNKSKDKFHTLAHNVQVYETPIEPRKVGESHQIAIDDPKLMEKSQTVRGVHLTRRSPLYAIGSGSSNLSSGIGRRGPKPYGYRNDRRRKANDIACFGVYAEQHLPSQHPASPVVPTIQDSSNSSSAQTEVNCTAPTNPRRCRQNSSFVTSSAQSDPRAQFAITSSRRTNALRRRSEMVPRLQPSAGRPQRTKGGLIEMGHMFNNPQRSVAPPMRSRRNRNPFNGLINSSNSMNDA